MTALQTYKYDEYKARRKFQFEPLQVEFANFPELIEDEDFGGADTFELREILPAAVSALFAKECYLVVGYVGLKPDKSGEIDSCYAFVYFKDRTFQFLKVELAGHFLDWLVALSDDNSYVSFGGFQFAFSAHESGVQAGLRFNETLEEVIENPLKLIKKRVPMFFKLEQVKRAKDKFFSKFELTNDLKPEISSSEITSKIDALFKSRKVEPQAPATDEEIADFEAHAGITMPEEYKALYRFSNGAPELFFGRDFLSLIQVKKEWDVWKSVYDSWTIEDLKSGYKGQSSVTFGVYCQPNWIPFIDFVGDFLAFDLIPLKKGKLGQIILFGREIHHIKQIAPDLDQFLKSCLALSKGDKNELSGLFSN